MAWTLCNRRQAAWLVPGVRPGRLPAAIRLRVYCASERPVCQAMPPRGSPAGGLVRLEAEMQPLDEGPANEFAAGIGNALKSVSDNVSLW